jgi:two-component system, NarL family, response regulator NreC
VCPPAQTQPESLARAGKIRCVLVHDHLLLREALRRLLEDEPDLEVVAETANVTEALQTISEHQPEVVIADARTMGLPVGEAEKLLLHESPVTTVLFLSRHEESGLRGFPASPDGFPAVPASSQELLTMVRNACRHHHDAPDAGHEQWREREGLPSPKRSLTAREQEVLKLLAEGSTVRSAARTLGLSMKTVDAHKFNLMRKLGVHNKAELVMWAIRKQVVKIPANS